jgi:16S rRNA (adenine1518-N6/adenine1519-N6)-dimethyltransferase
MHKAKKQFGQHFLKDTRVCKKMIDASDLQKKDTVLEIGPGEGVLTAFLLESGAHVIAIEKDRDLIPILRARFQKAITAKKLMLIEGDIRDIDLKKLKLAQYKVIANIPYYISGLLFRFFLENKLQPQVLTFLVQKEVAERICAKDHKESILSLAVKAYGEPVYIYTVKRGAFAPPPRVDSAVLSIKNISRKNFSSKKHESTYFSLIKQGFHAPRKQIGGIFKKDEAVLKLLEDEGIGRTTRPEDISFSSWVSISRKKARLR